MTISIQRPLRVVVLLPSEAIGATGGAAVQLDRLLRGWRGLGHHVELLAPKDTGSATVEKLLTQWRTTPPDIVHAEVPGALALALFKPLHAAGIPITSSFHHTFIHAPPGMAPRALAFLLRFHLQCALTVAESAGSLHLASALGLRELGLIRRGVDDALFAPSRRDPALRKTWGVGEQDPVLLWAGRLVPVKQPLDLVGVLAAVRQRCPRAKLVIAGEGPELPRVRATLPSAIYTGALDQATLARHYASADLLVHTAPHEPAGNIHLEAAASGLAVVGRSGDNLTELLVPAGAGRVANSAAELAQQATRLAADPALRRTMGEAGRNLVAVCGALAASEAWIAAWRRLLAAGRPVGKS